MVSIERLVTAHGERFVLVDASRLGGDGDLMRWASPPLSEFAVRRELSLLGLSQQSIDECLESARLNDPLGTGEPQETCFPRAVVDRDSDRPD
jgi:hypothetical protein